MEKIVVEWRIRANLMLRMAQVEGVVFSNDHDYETYRMLLDKTVELTELANKNKGVLIPFSARPLKKNVEFSYFEVIFKNNEDLNTFIELFQSRSSN